MGADSFLDTNIIINYVNYNKHSPNELHKKCRDYIISKSGQIVVCFAVVNELYSVMTKRSKIHRIVLEMIEKNEPNLVNNLPPREIPLAKKLYLQFRDRDLYSLENIFLKERELFEMGIELFLKDMVSKRVIPISDIDSGLVSNIHNYIDNHDDCKILASALQYQKDKDSFFFVTADSDFSPNEYNFLKEQFQINYSRESWIFPELKNLLFEN